MTRAKLTPAECWSRWRWVLEEAGRYCETAEATGGDELAFTPEFKRALYDLRDVAFPVDGLSSDQMAQAFRLQAQALITVALPERRVAFAAGLAGSVRALEGLWHAEQGRLTRLQLVRTGAGD